MADSKKNEALPEVTDEMIAAGVKVLRESGRLEGHAPYGDPDLVKKIISSSFARAR